jgi:hypothetical protein
MFIPGVVTMDPLDQRASELQAQIGRLKSALQGTTSEAERSNVHAQIDRCIRESLALIEQRLQRVELNRLRERQVGEE